MLEIHLTNFPKVQTQLFCKNEFSDPWPTLLKNSAYLFIVPGPRVLIKGGILLPEVKIGSWGQKELILLCIKHIYTENICIYRT